ncbi:MAG: sensor histidine kinase [Pseudomonadota bacterium]
MKRSGARSGRLFRKYALVIIGLVCAALLLSGGISIYSSYQANKLALWRLQHEKAVSAANRFEQFLRQIDRQLDIAALPQLGDKGERQRQTEFIKLFNEAPAITDVALIDARGREHIFMSRLALDVYGSGRDRSGEPAVRATEAGKSWHGNVYFRKETEPYMTIAHRSGNYLVLAEVNLKLIWDVVSAIKIGEHGKAYVVDAKGYLIADPDIGQVLRKTDLSRLAQVRAAMNEQEDEPARLARTLGGAQVLTAFAPIAATGWNVFVEQPVDEVYATLYASITRMAWLLLLGLALSTVASVLFARRMVRPIGVLQEGAQRIGAGDLEQRIDIHSGDELETLAEQFNDMSSQLRQSYASLERKVQERTAELQQTLTTLTQAQKQLVESEKMAALGGLVAGVAHEINTPVGVGVTAASSLQESALRLHGLYREGKMMKADLEDFLDVSEQSSRMILSNLERAASLVHSFKQVAVDQSSEAKRNFNVRVYLEEILTSLSPALNQTLVRYTIVCPDDIVICSTPGTLSQIVSNLVMNALTHAFELQQAGQLTISARLSGGTLLLDFADDGKGIPPDIIGKIFDPFFTTRRGMGGSGLGLNIVYNLVTQSLQGSIECISTVGQGTTFAMQFPVELADG